MQLSILQTFENRLTRYPLDVKLSREVVAHLGHIAVLLAGKLDAEAVGFQRGPRSPGGLHSLVTDRCWGYFSQSSLLRAGAVPATTLVVQEHAWGAPHGSHWHYTLALALTLICGMVFWNKGKWYIVVECFIKVVKNVLAVTRYV